MYQICIVLFHIFIFQLKRLKVWQVYKEIIVENDAIYQHLIYVYMYVLSNEVN